MNRRRTSILLLFAPLYPLLVLLGGDMSLGGFHVAYSAISLAVQQRHPWLVKRILAIIKSLLIQSVLLQPLKLFDMLCTFEVVPQFSLDHLSIITIRTPPEARFNQLQFLLLRLSDSALMPVMPFSPESAANNTWRWSCKSHNSCSFWWSFGDCWNCKS